MSKNLALIIAGGAGIRMGQDIPKQFLHVYDRPVIIYTLEVFQKHPNIDGIEIACLPGWHDILRAYCRQFNITKLLNIVDGGINGQDSIRNGVFDLEKNFAPDDIVVIHDAIRPLISEDIISDNIRVCQTYGNAVTVVPCAEAMLLAENATCSNGQVPRNLLRKTQTPQSFRLGEFAQVHRDALKNGITASVASCTLYIEMGKKMYFSIGSEKNLKLTTVEDIEIFKALLNLRKAEWLK